MRTTNGNRPGLSRHVTPAIAKNCANRKQWWTESTPPSNPTSPKALPVPKQKRSFSQSVAAVRVVKFTAVRANAQQRKVVFEGTIDTLPTHAPIVTRWLRVYVLYDTTSKTIIRTTVTIRGQVLE